METHESLFSNEYKSEESYSLSEIVHHLDMLASTRRSRELRRRERKKEQKNDTIISRRHFLRLSGVTMLLPAIDYLNETYNHLKGHHNDEKNRHDIDPQEDDEQQIDKNFQEKIKLLDDDGLEKYMNSVLYAGINILVSDVIKRIALARNIPVGNLSGGKESVAFPKISQTDARDIYGRLTNKNTQREDNEFNKLVDIINSVFTLPLAEELLYRYFIPKMFIGKGDHSIRWDVGIATSYLFGYHHNLSAPEDIDNETVRKVIPVHQIGLGLVCHYLAREGGFSQALAAHTANNTMAYILDAFDKLSKDDHIPV